MITDEDIKRIIEAEREVFPTKGDFQTFQEEIREQFSELQTAVDSYAKKADAYFQEMLMLAHKVDRHERWLQQIAAKLDIKLEYD